MPYKRYLLLVGAIINCLERERMAISLKIRIEIINFSRVPFTCIQGRMQDNYSLLYKKIRGKHPLSSLPATFSLGLGLYRLL